MPEPERKWLSLYRMEYLTRVSDVTSTDDDTDAELDASDGPAGVTVAALPDAVLRDVFARLDAASLACVAQTCIGWRALAYEPATWRALAERAWPAERRAALQRLLWCAPPPGPYLTWRRLVAFRPRVRHLGFYVQRTQYAKSRRAAVNADGSAAPPVFLVTYWRMLRFFPDGRALSLTTPEAPDRAYRRFFRNWRPQAGDGPKMRPTVGSFVFREDSRTVDVTLPLENELYPRAMTGFQHLSMSLTETHAGAYNRLYQMDNFAIMDDGSVVTYQQSEPGARHGKAFRFIPLHGFAKRVYDHYPREASTDGRLLNWPTVWQ